MRNESNKQNHPVCHSSKSWNPVTHSSGRSMLEMLGVLAIIGVLSIGALSAYTAAMNKHRANRILHDVSLAFAEIQTKEEVPEGLLDVGFTPDSGLTINAFRNNDGYDFVQIEGVLSNVCENLLQYKNSGNIGLIYSADGTTELTTCGNNQTMIFGLSDTAGSAGTVTPPVTNPCEGITAANDCSIAQNEYNANNCLIKTKITCTGATPVCNNETGACRECTLTCQDNFQPNAACSGCECALSAEICTGDTPYLSNRLCACVACLDDSDCLIKGGSCESCYFPKRCSPQGQCNNATGQCPIGYARISEESETCVSCSMAQTPCALCVNDLECGEKGTCENGICQCESENNESLGHCCSEGKKWSYEEKKCVASCASNANCSELGDNYFCRLESLYLFSSNSEPDFGLCTPVQTSFSGVVNGTNFSVSKDSMSWWAAQNFCQALGQTPVNSSFLGCYGSSYCATETIIQITDAIKRQDLWLEEYYPYARGIYYRPSSDESYKVTEHHKSNLNFFAFCRE